MSIFKKKTLILIPMKDPEKSKTRLEGSLSSIDRAYLSRSLFKRTLTVLQKIVKDYPNLYLELAVISASVEISEISKYHNTRFLVETGEESLNNATEIAKKWATLKNYEAICIFPADLANPDPLEIISFIKEADSDRFITISPSSDLGTNALHLSLPSSFEFKFGEKSFLKHLDSAERAGVKPKVLPLPSLKYDIDTSKDLRYLQDVDIEL